MARSKTTNNRTVSRKKATPRKKTSAKSQTPKVSSQRKKEILGVIMMALALLLSLALLTYHAADDALARDTGCKIIPVAHNAGDYWGRRSVIKRPGKIRCVIGPPIDASGREPKETNLIVQDWIETKMREISSLYQD